MEPEKVIGLRYRQAKHLRAMEEVMNFINTCDETCIRKFRAKLYAFCMQSRAKESLQD